MPPPADSAWTTGYTEAGNHSDLSFRLADYYRELARLPVYVRYQYESQLRTKFGSVVLCTAYRAHTK
jgi:hypothetical protein